MLFGNVGRRASTALAVVVVVVVVVAARAALAAPATAGAMYLRPTAVVDAGDGAALALYCAGSGSPTVLMDAGLGDGAYQWALVQPEIATHTRVCSYDRAGYMFSTGLPEPRTSDRIVTELHALIVRAHLGTPVVLVGHSFGSFNVRLFADRYPALVAGLVLIDGSHEDQTRLFPASYRRLVGAVTRREAACLAAAKRGRVPTDPYCQPGVDSRLAPALAKLVRSKYARPVSLEAMSSEERLFDRSAAQVRAARRSFGTLPLLVVTAGKTARGGAPGMSAADVRSAEATWMRLQARLATLSTGSEHVTVADSSHYIQHDAPWVVIAAVEHVVDRARKAAGHERIAP